MPVPTVEQLTKKEATLKQSIAEQGESLERVKRRGLAKRLRRIQRKRRRLAAEAIRIAPKPSEKEAKAEETKPAEASAAAEAETTEEKKEE